MTINSWTRKACRRFHHPAVKELLGALGAGRYSIKGGDNTRFATSKFTHRLSHRDSFSVAVLLEVPRLT